MATSQIASMLDELMGRNRNVAPNEKVREIRWSDPEVCRYFLVDFCPHDLFTNTKVDLGPCGKIHDEELRRKFQEEKAENHKKTQVVDEFVRFCQRMLTELQARIKKAKERLHLTQNDDVLPPSASGQHKETEEKIVLLSKRITALVEEAEKAGCDGNVEQAQGLMKLSDQLREEREHLRRSIMPFFKEEFAQQQKAMEVCDTCGAFLIVGDAQQRIDDHLMGKQHIGYAKVRASVDAILEERRKVREERDKEIEERRRKRTEEDNKRRRDRKRSSRSRERSRSSKQRSRSHSRSPKRAKSDGQRRKRSRSRDRNRDKDRGDGKRERDRDRDRDKDRDRKRRSRSRDRRR